MEYQRLFLYTALGILAILLWNAWQADYHQAPVATVATEQQPAAPDAPSAPAVGGAPAAAQSGGAAAAAQTVRVLTDLLDVEISTRGGEIRQVRLREYSVSVKDPTPFTLLFAQGSELFVAQSGLQAQGGAPAPGIDAIYQTPQLEYTLADGQDELVVPLTWTSPEGIEVTKRFVFRRNDYLIDLQHQVRNGSDTPWQGFQYSQLRRSPVSGASSMFVAHSYTGGVLHSPDDRYQKLSFDDMAESRLQRDIANGWLAMIQHYFLAAWIPPSDVTYRYYTQYVDGHYVFGASSPWMTVAPGDEGRVGTRLYVGPKEPDRLEAVAPDLELTVDYGKLTIIAKPLYWLLDKLHSVVGNWGWAIVLLTLLIKLVFYKLSETSYRSMARMRTLQPKMQALKERYGDDRQRLNQELMELYKREKINPLGGCLPILVQIPVFIALYWVLLESVALRQAEWILWIKDLSAPDPYFVLPILMGVSMLVQQKLNPAPMDPVQQRVFMIMPVVFTVFFLFFPAGLVLYWVTNNVLSIAQQWVITRRIENATKAKS